MAQFTVNATAVRSLQELQVPGEVGRPLRGGRQQGRRARSARPRWSSTARAATRAPAASRPAAPSTRPSRSSAASRTTPSSSTGRTRSGTSAPGSGAEVSLQGLPQGHHHRPLQRGRPEGHLLPGLPLLGVGVPGAARPRRQRQRHRDPAHQAGERGLGARRRVSEPAEPSFTEPAGLGRDRCRRRSLLARRPAGRRRSIPRRRDSRRLPAADELLLADAAGGRPAIRGVAAHRLLSRCVVRLAPGRTVTRRCPRSDRRRPRGAAPPPAPRCVRRPAGLRRDLPAEECGERLDLELRSVDLLVPAVLPAPSRVRDAQSTRRAVDTECASGCRPARPGGGVVALAARPDRGRRPSLGARGCVERVDVDRSAGRARSPDACAQRRCRRSWPSSTRRPRPILDLRLPACAHAFVAPFDAGRIPGPGVRLERDVSSRGPPARADYHWSEAADHGDCRGAGGERTWAPRGGELAGRQLSDFLVHVAAPRAAGWRSRRAGPGTAGSLRGPNARYRAAELAPRDLMRVLGLRVRAVGPTDHGRSALSPSDNVSRPTRDLADGGSPQRTVGAPTPRRETPARGPPALAQTRASDRAPIPRATHRLWAR